MGDMETWNPRSPRDFSNVPTCELASDNWYVARDGENPLTSLCTTEVACTANVSHRSKEERDSHYSNRQLQGRGFIHTWEFNMGRPKQTLLVQRRDNYCCFPNAAEMPSFAQSSNTTGCGSHPRAFARSPRVF